MENGALWRVMTKPPPPNNKNRVVNDYGGRHRHRKRSFSVVCTGKPPFPRQTCRIFFAISSVTPRSLLFQDRHCRRLRTPQPPRSSQPEGDQNSEGDGDGNPLEEKKGEAKDPEEGEGDGVGVGVGNGRAWWDFFNKRRKVRVLSEKGSEEGERITDSPRGGLWKLFSRAEQAKQEEASPDSGIKLVLDGEEVEIRWRGLFDVSSPENLLAVVLAGTLALAALQIVWQLFLAVAAIALSALKYSVVAALLIALIVFIL